MTRIVKLISRDGNALHVDFGYAGPASVQQEPAAICGVNRAICATIAAAPGGSFRGGRLALYAALKHIPERRIRQALALLLATGEVFEDRKEHIYRLVIK